MIPPDPAKIFQVRQVLRPARRCLHLHNEVDVGVELRDRAGSRTMVLVFAESAYLFRHALLRDAAYQLQLPGYRAHLHGLALRILEAHFGGRRPSTTEAHPSDPFAEDLAAHAALAAGAPGADAEEFTALQRLYLRGAAGHADR